VCEYHGPVQSDHTKARDAPEDSLGKLKTLREPWVGELKGHLFDALEGQEELLVQLGCARFPDVQRSSLETHLAAFPVKGLPNVQHLAQVQVLRFEQRLQPLFFFYIQKIVELLSNPWVTLQKLRKMQAAALELMRIDALKARVLQIGQTQQTRQRKAIVHALGASSHSICQGVIA
jgi:hypothetical protein